MKQRKTNIARRNKKKRGPESGKKSGGGRRQCRDCRICSVLGVGNGREIITVEPFLQIMTPARKRTEVLWCTSTHSQPWENMLVHAEYWGNRFFLQRKKWWLRENLSDFAHSKYPHVAHFDKKNDAFNRAPHFALPLHSFHSIALLPLEISKRLSRRQSRKYK